MKNYSVLSPVDWKGETHKTGVITTHSAEEDDAIWPLVESGSVEESNPEVSGHLNLQLCTEAQRVAMLEQAVQLGIANAEALSDEELSSEVYLAQARIVMGLNQNGATFQPFDHSTGAQGPNSSTVAEVIPGAAVLSGAQLPDGRIVELNEMELPLLQKLGKNMGVKSANKLNKEALIEAITAIELTVTDKDK